MIDPYEIAVVGRSLNRKYYLATYPDVAAAAIDPVRHYCATGWRQGLNPSPSFDTNFYLKAYPDVAAAGINPFWHYLVAGINEERRTRDGRMTAVRRRLDSARPPSGKPYFRADGRALTASDIVAHTDLAKPLIVSVSHDDYAANLGGVQIVIADEVAALNGSCNHMHLSPAEPRQTLAREEGFQFRIRLNGSDLGNATGDVIRAVLMASANLPIAWAVHHLMGHSPELVADLVETVRPAKLVVWAHDYFATCPNPNLLRNDVSFCGAPPPESQACGICVYGEQRSEHRARIAAFLERTEPTVVAPSHTALELWARFTDRPRIGLVRPIAELSFGSFGEVATDKERIRIGFLGMRQYHKGWATYAELAAEFANDPRYEFIQLGAEYGDAAQTGIPLLKVGVSSSSRYAMIDALAYSGVDVVVTWSIWPETFNLTIHEAIAAGVFVVVRRDVGNPLIAARLFAGANSAEAASAAELFELFRSGELMRALKSAPRRRAALVPMGGAADLLLAAVHQ